MLDALGACFMDQLMGLKDERECGPKLHKSKCVNPRDECFVWMIFVYLFMLDKDTRALHEFGARLWGANNDSASGAIADEII
jgi:hypothetical protein